MTTLRIFSQPNAVISLSGYATFASSDDGDGSFPPFGYTVAAVCRLTL